MSSTVCLYCARYHFEPMRTEPLGIRYLHAYLLAQGLLLSEHIHIVDDFKSAATHQPDIVGVSAVSQVIPDAIDFAMKCKDQFDCLTVLGGYGITASPNKLPEPFDLGVIGEGEVTFTEIVSQRLHGASLDDLRMIPGTCHHGSGNEPGILNHRPFITDLDSLPYPHWDNKNIPDAPVFTSRGCPYRCSFCDAHSFWRKTYRLHSARYMADMVQHYHTRYGSRTIHFLDDLWIANKQRLHSFIAELERRSLLGVISFYGFVRSNLIHEEEVKLLKRMNYTFLRFGAESASDRILTLLKGEGISVVDHQRTIDLCHSYGIPCGASFMFGVPGETIYDLELTRSFLRRNRRILKIAGLYPFTPIPGTDLYNSLVAKNIITSEMDTERAPRDFQRSNFSWDEFKYFNHNAIPLADFRTFIEELREEFCPLPPADHNAKPSLVTRAAGKIFRIFRKSIHLDRPSMPSFDRPIFIVGHARGGSTLFAALINHHSQVGPKYSMIKHANSIDDLCKQALSERHHLDYGSAIEQTGTWSSYFRGRGTLVNSEDELLAEVSGLSPSRLNQLKRDLGKRLHEPRFLSKNPTNSYRIRALLELFPDAKIIALYRSGPEVVNSWGKRNYGFGRPFNYGSERHDQLSYPEGIRIFSHKWSRLLEYVELVRSEVGFLALTYDNLIIDPRSTMQKVLRYLELPEEPYLSEINLEDRRDRWRKDIPSTYHNLLVSSTQDGQRIVDAVTTEFFNIP